MPTKLGAGNQQENYNENTGEYSKTGNSKSFDKFEKSEEKQIYKHVFKQANGLYRYETRDGNFYSNILFTNPADYKLGQTSEEEIKEINDNAIKSNDKYREMNKKLFDVYDKVINKELSMEDAKQELLKIDNRNKPYIVFSDYYNELTIIHGGDMLRKEDGYFVNEHTYGDLDGRIKKAKSIDKLYEYKPLDFTQENEEAEKFYERKILRDKVSKMSLDEKKEFYNNEENREEIFQDLDEPLYGKVDRNSGGGYRNKSMSNRAEEAYSQGQKPLSKWTKDSFKDEIEYIDELEPYLEEIDNTSLKELKNNLLEESGWHHTGSLYNATTFYGMKSPKKIMEYFTNKKFANFGKK